MSGGVDDRPVVATGAGRVMGRWSPGSDGADPAYGTARFLLTLGAKPDAARRWLDEPSIEAIDGSAALLGRYATDAVLRSTVPRVVAARSASSTSGPT